MNIWDGLVQKLGEEVGLYERTAEEGEFGQAEKLSDATKDAAEKLLKELAPENASTWSPFKSTQTAEEKSGETLIKCGQALQNADKYKSLFGSGVECLGEGFKKIGLEHADLDNRVLINTIEPLRAYNDGQLKELQALKKRYDSNRLEYDSAKRACETKKSPETEDKLNRAKERYEEAKNAYWQRLQHTQDREQDQLAQLQAYAAAQAVYNRKCAEVWDAIANQLAGLAKTPSSRPAAPGPITYAPSSTPTLTATPTTAPIPSPAPQQGRPLPQGPQYPIPPAGGRGGGPPPMGGGVPLPTRGGGGGGGRGGVARGGGGPPPMGGVARGGGGPPPMGGGRGGVGGGGGGMGRCKALYEFNAEAPNELSLKPGDVVVVTGKVNADWWEGECNGRTGIFPTSYTQPL